MSLPEFNKVVVIGASGGIGSAIAKSLLTQCRQLCLTGRDVDRLEALRGELMLGASDDAATITTAVADISEQQGRDTVVQLCTDDQMADLVICAAGQNGMGMFYDQPPETIQAIVHTNLLSVMLLVRGLVDRASSRGPMQIILFGSVLGNIGMPGYSAYCASKFGLKGFAQALDRELCDEGIRVRLFSPRTTATSMNNEKMMHLNELLGNQVDSVSVVVKQFLSFLAKDHQSRTLGAAERFFSLLNAVMPSLPAKVLKKKVSVIKRVCGSD